MKNSSKHMGKTNWPVTILLILGCVTIFFPLYMAVIIAFKKPSEMTNDIAGALSFPSSWSFDNFAEAMRVTDFWNSLGNSLLITAVTVVIAILLHSLAAMPLEEIWETADFISLPIFTLSAVCSYRLLF